jgi:2-(1,2-epoxy-1,2-dihydrophenyl)acetyl-CoA isomerase
MAELVLLDQAEGVATLTLNRSDKLNSLGQGMPEQLIAALDRVGADRGARVLVITGAGRAFCTGGDLREMAALRRERAGFESVKPLLESGRTIVTRLAGMRLPTIAAVNGPAAGAGLALALACDLRLASDEATFTQAHARLGLHCGWGASYFLPRLVGLARAYELSWSTKVTDAAEARRIGLVNHVFERAAFASEVRRFALRLAAASSFSVQHAKRALARSPQRSLEQCLDAEIEGQERCWAAADSAEGLAAFTERREPVFQAAVDDLDEPPRPAARRFE